MLVISNDHYIFEALTAATGLKLSYSLALATIINCSPVSFFDPPMHWDISYSYNPG